MSRPGTPVASNTSTIPLVKLIAGLPDAFARDFLITHFFNPPRYMRLLEVVRDGLSAPPAAILGLPVGFVGAAESKRALAENPLGLDYLVVHGRRGGSAMAVAAVNAMASEAE